MDGPDAGSAQTFTVPRVTVGRSRACHMIVADASISALHFELRIRGETVELRDLDSTNGTHLGERRVFHVELHRGDRFTAGDVGFELLEAGEVEVPVSADDRFEEMWGSSAIIREVFGQLDALAGATMDVLVAGETGTGKEVAARSLHQRSGRTGALVSLDCANLAPHALEVGFEDARGGTVLLDELSELPLDQQPRLLRMLDRRTARSGHEGHPGPPDARVIASTRADLSKMVASQQFREDLYFRIAQAVVELPPLRERGEDIELLAAQFVAEQSGLAGGRPLDLADDARVALRDYRWPGNVRELRNVIQRAVHLARGPRIHASDLALRDHGDLMGLEELLALPYREAHMALDRYYLRRIMAETRGNITRAAQRLGTSRRSLRERLKRLDLYTVE
ncbi:MAG: sigma 54-interacting transcriptional regulator [Deltaproteobacteria bacterium]|nr:sigma 54-interacting transcriptional regulator [Deltaproteobacteria bacterium]